MSDYTRHLECGCLNWCRCGDPEKYACKRLPSNRTLELYECIVCKSVTTDYEGHSTYHTADDRKSVDDVFHDIAPDGIQGAEE